MTPEYPEHEKLEAVRDQRDAVQRFLDWLRIDKGFILCVPHEHQEGCKCDDDWHIGPAPEARGEYFSSSCPACFSGSREHPHNECGYAEGQYQNLHLHPRDIMAMYFDIDLDKLELEKVEMLNFMKELNRG